MKRLTKKFVKSLVLPAVLLVTGVAVLSAAEDDGVRDAHKKLHEQYIASNPIYADARLQAYINKIGQRVAAVSKPIGVKYKFFLIDSFDVNAFAAPGGYIYLHRGLLIQLQNEAQLAAVLGHEVGHIAGRHHSRGAAKRGAGTFATIIAAILTGSQDAMDAANVMSQASTMGHKRELELEADELGLEYLAKAGYDPEAMVEVIGVLRTNRRFVKELAAREGKTPNTYHGVFATHPRDDQRLRKGTALLPEDTTIRYTDNSEFRAAVDGLLYGGGTLPQSAPKPVPGAFVDKANRYSVRFPEDWKTETGPPVTSASAEQDEWVAISVSSRNGAKTPEEYVQTRSNTILLAARDLRVNNLAARMGAVKPEGEVGSQRLAVVFNGNRVYEVNYYNKEGSKASHDKRFEEILSTLQAYRDPAARPQKLPRIKYVKAKEGLTFALLVRALHMGRYGEQQLRAINGYYPYGEPDPGEWIKIVQ